MASSGSILFPFVSIKVIPLQQSQHTCHQSVTYSQDKGFYWPNWISFDRKDFGRFQVIKIYERHTCTYNERVAYKNGWCFASCMLQSIWKLIIQVTIHISVFWCLLFREVSLHWPSSGRICLTVDDITFSDNKLIVRVWISKTHKTGKMFFLHISLVGDKSICPIAAMQQFIRLRSSVSGCLFIHGIRLPVTRYQFGAILNKAISYACLSNKFLRIILLGLDEPPNWLWLVFLLTR